MNRSLRVLACACTLGAASSLAHADGIGTSVTGVLTLSQVGSNPGANCCDPASPNNPSAPPTAPGDAPGIVPPAAGNAAGPTVTIGPGIEFESDILSPSLVFSADFTGSTLSIFTEALGYLTPFEMGFTDTAFTSFTQLTSSVQTVTNPTDPTAFTYSFSGDTLKVFFPGESSPGTIATTTFSYNQPAAVTPAEPSTIVFSATHLPWPSTVRQNSA